MGTNFIDINPLCDNQGLQIMGAGMIKNISTTLFRNLKKLSVGKLLVNKVQKPDLYANAFGSENRVNIFIFTFCYAKWAEIPSFSFYELKLL